MTKTIRLMIVDDQELMRDGLTTILGRQADIEVVASVADGMVAVQTAHDTTPHVVLMDVRMPVMNGVEATQCITDQLPDTRVLMLTTFDDDEYIVGALQAGAVGYVLKNIPSDELAEAIRGAYRGIVQLDSSAAAKLVQRLESPIYKRLDPIVEKQLTGLTQRELEVMQLVATGATNREIAEQLVISEGTVKTHVSSILGQLHLRDRTQLAIFVHTHDLLKS